MSATSAPPEVDKSASRIRGMFSAIAPYYDTLNHLLSLNIDKEWRHKVVRMVPPQLGNGPVLDIATGTGDLALEYLKAGGGKVPIVGGDFCGPLLNKAMLKQKRLEEKLRDKLAFVQADAMNLPFEDEEFQIVSIAFGLRNIADTMRGLSEMVRVTKPGGSVVVLEFSKPSVVGLKQLYLFYFRKVLPGIGQAFSKSPDAAYNYLPDSVLQFPDGEALAQMMRQAGLGQVRFVPLTLGVATIYQGVKL